MNKPTPRIDGDPDFGAVDEDGARIWSLEEDEAIARVTSTPEFRAALARGDADIAAGRAHTHEDVVAQSAERRRRCRAERGL